MSFTDFKIKISGPDDASEALAEDLGDFDKVSELRTRNRTRRVDFRGSQRPGEFARYGFRTRWGWQMEKPE